MRLDDIVHHLDRVSLYKIGGSKPGQTRWRCLLLLKASRLIETESDTPEKALHLALTHVPSEFLSSEA